LANDDLLSGELWKKGKGVFKKEAKRYFWFSPDATTLYYGKVHNSPKRKAIPLNGLKVQKKKDSKKTKKFWIHLDSTDKKAKKAVRDIACNSAQERDEWIRALSGEAKQNAPIVENETPVAPKTTPRTPKPSAKSNPTDSTVSSSNSSRSSSGSTHTSTEISTGTESATDSLTQASTEVTGTVTTETGTTSEESTTGSRSSRTDTGTGTSQDATDSQSEQSDTASSSN